jgi:hypothetical protein
MDKNPENNVPQKRKKSFYFFRLIGEAKDEFGIREIVFDLIASLMSTLLAVHFKYAQSSEEREQVFSAILYFLGFFGITILFHLIFYTPYKIIKAQDKEKEELERQISDKAKIQKRKDALGGCRRSLASRIAAIQKLAGWEFEKQHREVPRNQLDPDTSDVISYIHDFLNENFSGADAEWFLSSADFDPPYDGSSERKTLSIQRLTHYAKQLDKIIENHIND